MILLEAANGRLMMWVTWVVLVLVGVIAMVICILSSNEGSRVLYYTTSMVSSVRYYGV